jgi:hypothetical protein
VMRSMMRDGDEELEAPPRGVGASLMIRCRLPRQGGGQCSSCVA